MRLFSCFFISLLFSFPVKAAESSNPFDSVKEADEEQRAREKVAKMIAVAGDVNGGESEYAPLHEAVMIGKPLLVKLLLEQKADIDRKQKANEYTRLMNKAFLQVAQARSALGIRTKGKEKGVDIDYTPLHLAAKYNIPEVVSLLLQRGANANAQTARGWTPLHYAAQGGALSSIEALLNHKKTNPGIQTKSLLTPLMVAVIAGKEEAVRLLAADATMVNFQNHRKQTCLHFLAATDLKNASKVFKILREHGADPKIKSWREVTPLHIAAFYGNVGQLKLLIENEALLDAQDWEGKTALHYATEKGHADCIKFLLERGASTTLRTFSKKHSIKGHNVWSFVGKNKRIKALFKGKAKNSLQAKMKKRKKKKKNRKDVKAAVKEILESAS